MKRRGVAIERNNNYTNPVVGLLNTMMDKRELSLKGVAALIGYDYQNLWNVYKEKKTLPILNLLRLCVELEYENPDKAAIEFFVAQPKGLQKSLKKDEKSDSM